jgi:diguanylate cyclase (GGDEF)-like protein/PAS domain S-box-containing protein
MKPTSQEDQPPRPSARSALVAAWLRALGPTGFTPIPRSEFERLLTGHVDAIAEAMAAEPVAVDAGRRAGADLVEARFTDSECLQATLLALGPGLLAVAEEAGLPDAQDRAFALLGAVGAGYASAFRDWLFSQQEEVKLALARANGEVERRLRRSEAWFREVFVRSALGIAISDAGGKLAQVNPALADILGLDDVDLVGRSIEEFVHPQDAVDVRTDYHELGVLGGKPLRRRRRLIRADGQLVWVHLTVSVLRDVEDMPTLHLTMVENVSDLHLLQDLTSHQTLHDVLTGLPNRQYLLSQLQSQLGGQAAGETVTLFLLDLDGFAAINHGLGTEHGDRLLTVVARRLENLFSGRQVLVARHSGDEFALLFSGGCGSTEVLTTISQINEQLVEPVYLPDGGVGLSVCIGVAHGPVGRMGPSELLRRADVALRTAQATGKRQWAEYDGDRDEVDRRRAALAATMSGALEFGELTAMFQPWYRLADNELVGISVRAAWDHPEHGHIDDADCRELAEMTGAAVPMASWLIGVACDQARVWWDRFGAVTPPVGIALTPSQVADPDLVGTIGAAMDTSGVEPGMLRFAVPTEILAGERGEAWDNVGVLAGMGVSVLFGDVGVAPVELMLIGEWPIDTVQLAERLVRSVAWAGPESRLAKAGGALVHGLREVGIGVVVPGVRTAAEIGWWSSVGAEVASGPYFSPPLTADGMATALAERAERQRQRPAD